MMKRFLILLALILILILPAALAEDAALYTPGEMTTALFTEAFDRGDMLKLDMQFEMELSENADAVFGEETASTAAVAELLENSIFTVGVQKIDSGLRVVLKGDYTVDAQTVCADATLDLTDAGAALESSILPGEQITASWETLLAMAGMSEEEIAAAMGLREMDTEALLAELVAAFEPMIEMAAQIAAPYGETILQHVAGLPMVINENVPAEAGYPAAAAEMQIEISEKAIGDMIIALANQLKQDATLCALFDSILAETATDDAPAITTALLCDAIIEVVSEDFTDESQPYNVFVGTDADGNLLYLNLSKNLEDSTILLISFISGQLEENGATLFNADLLLLTAEEEILNGFSIVYAYAIDDANRNVMSAELVFSAYADGAELISCNLYTDNAVNPENPNAYDGLLAMEMAATDGETDVSMALDTNFFSLFTENGEEMLIEGSTVVSADDEAIDASFEFTLVTSLDGGTPVTVMTEASQLPALGIAQWSETYTLTAVPYTPDAVQSVIALESATAEELESLSGRVMTNIEQLLATLYEILPAELTETAD